MTTINIRESDLDRISYVNRTRVNARYLVRFFHLESETEQTATVTISGDTEKGAEKAMKLFEREHDGCIALLAEKTGEEIKPMRYRVPVSEFAYKGDIPENVRSTQVVRASLCNWTLKVLAFDNFAKKVVTLTASGYGRTAGDVIAYSARSNEGVLPFTMVGKKFLKASMISTGNADTFVMTATEFDEIAEFVSDTDVEIGEPIPGTEVDEIVEK